MDFTSEEVEIDQKYSRVYLVVSLLKLRIFQRKQQTTNNLNRRMNLLLNGNEIDTLEDLK